MLASSQFKPKMLTVFRGFVSLPTLRVENRLILANAYIVLEKCITIYDGYLEQKETAIPNNSSSSWPSALWSYLVDPQANSEMQSLATL